MSESVNRNLLAQARAGDQHAPSELLKAHNQLLEQMARKEVDHRLQARLSAADIVQQTCLSAIRNFSDIQGENQHQLAAWLRGMLEDNVKDMVRHHVVAQKRAVSNQRPLDERTPQREPSHTPSRRAMLDESVARLTRALDSLPEAQAEAIRLRHLEQLSLNQIAERMNRTDVAVASLLKRGVAALRRLFPDDSAEI
ncbi:MAG: sigma-70 family RNA polymerase sigma factor [Fuerstiella sp.]